VIPALAFAVLISAWNNILHLVPGRLREACATTGVGAAGASGLAWLLVHHPNVLSRSAVTLLVIGLAAAAGMLAIGLLRRWPRWTSVLEDSRIAAMSAREFVLHTVLRIPAVSALAEEILFRGVVWALLVAVGGAPVALIGTSAAFALWHVVVSAHQARRRGTPLARWVAGSLAATFAAGIGFGLLRLVTQSVWAPAAVHATINIVASVAARLAASPHSASIRPRHLPPWEGVSKYVTRSVWMRRVKRET
jgi:membrane protease YdiL (CAAX protease family)